jgi:hypothetical protein
MKTTLTYSALSKFKNCRKAYDWRYNRELVPLKRAEALYFGSVIHDALELWHRDRDLNAVEYMLNQTYSARQGDEKMKADWHKATAIMRAYAACYPAEAFKVVALEQVFETEIRQPETRCASRTFILRGKVDGIIDQDGRLYLLEHKTAGRINSGYLERLWHDMQIILYSYGIERALGIKLDGVLYNIIAKIDGNTKQGLGWTEEEYKIRHAAAAAKNKSGKSELKRKMPETDDAYQARLAEWHSKPEAFIRQELLISNDKIDELEAEIWELTQAILLARRTKMWYKNSSQCFYHNRPCAYWALCSAGGNFETILENLYRIEPPHGELVEDKKEDLPF